MTPKMNPSPGSYHIRNEYGKKKNLVLCMKRTFYYRILLLSFKLLITARLQQDIKHFKILALEDCYDDLSQIVRIVKLNLFSSYYAFIKYT